MFDVEVIDRMHELAMSRAAELVGGAVSDGDRWIIDRLRAKGRGMRAGGVYHGSGELICGGIGPQITVVEGATIIDEADDVLSFGLQFMTPDTKPAAVIRRMRWHLDRLVKRTALESKIETQSPGDTLGWRMPTRFKAWYLPGWLEYRRSL